MPEDGREGVEDCEAESCDRLTFLDGGGRKSVVVEVVVVVVFISGVVVDVGVGIECEAVCFEREGER